MVATAGTVQLLGDISYYITHGAHRIILRCEIYIKDYVV